MEKGLDQKQDVCACSQEQRIRENPCADLQYMEEIFQMQEVDIREYSPLALAYIGDAVYDLIIVHWC